MADWGNVLVGLGQAAAQVYSSRVQARAMKPRKRDAYLTGQPMISPTPPLGPSSYVVGGGYGGDPMYSMARFTGGNLALPGGAPTTWWEGLLGAAVPILSQRFGMDDPTSGPLDVLAQGTAEYISPQGCPSWLRPSTGVARPVRQLQVIHPQTGRVHWYRNVGQPLLFSGDLAVARRVGKLLGRGRARYGRVRRGR
jgi:hypothetical protein